MAAEIRAGLVRRAWDGDLAYSFRNSPVAMVSAVVTLVLILGAVLAPWVAPHNPFDLSTVSLLDAFDPPQWIDGGSPDFPLGTDEQGRDVLSAILFGARISLGVGLFSTIFAVVLGVVAGLIAGWKGGFIDALIMRVADVQLSFPSILDRKSVV